MPPTVIDLRRTEDARDVVHRAVQALAEGRCVGFPTETDYCVAGSLRHRATVEALLAHAPARSGEPRLSLALKGADESFDWAPGLSPVGRRLTRRCWPGPVVALVEGNHPDSLVHQLSPAARDAVTGDGQLRLRVPGHSMLADCMRMLAAPLLLAEPMTADGPTVTAVDVAAAAGDLLALVLDDGRARYAQPASTIELVDAGFRIVRPGIVAEETLQRLASLMVLFVCTGNTCRSPMAEAQFRLMVAESLGCRPDEVERRGVVIASAGLSAWGGRQGEPWCPRGDGGSRCRPLRPREPAGDRKSRSPS